MNKLFIFVAFFLLVLSWTGAAAAQGAAPEGLSLPDAILYPGEGSGHILVVDKAEQKLYLYRHSGPETVELERVINCSTGINRGDKMVEGDKKTPNGFYIFNKKLLPNELPPIYGTLAYPTDYPNFWDRELGRGGSGIWAHGINKPLTDYDSNGCVEMENADIARLEDLIRLHDTPLITYEALSLAPAEELQRQARELRAFVESWRKAWAEEDHQSYQAKYDLSFVNSDGRSLSGWMLHKRNVAQRYQRISVELKDLRLYRHRDVIVALFEQDYRGDSRFSSIGLKRLYIKDGPEGYKIVGEEFQALPDRETNKWLSAEEKRLALETPPLTVAEARLSTAEALGSSEQVALAAGQAPAPSGQSPPEEELPALEAALLQAEETALLVSQDNGDLERELAAARQAEAEAAARRAAEVQAQAEAQAAERAVREQRTQEARQQVLNAVELWAEAWRRRDADRYFSFYHPNFYYRAKKMNLAQFQSYRRSMMEATGSVGLDISGLNVEEAGEDLQASFRQDYRSDTVRDTGRKTLTFRLSDQGWKIIAETWRPISR